MQLGLLQWEPCFDLLEFRPADLAFPAPAAQHFAPVILHSTMDLALGGGELLPPPPLLLAAETEVPAQIFTADGVMRKRLSSRLFLCFA